MASASVLQALAVTAQVYGKEFSPEAAEMLASDLEEYPEAQILVALARCRKELRGFPCLAEIVSRIDDGRPGEEEAWAMVPKDEYSSVVWSDEMAEAFNVIRLMIAEDPVAARMAFKECYRRAVADARAARRPARWTTSLGHDKDGRAAALLIAANKGRIAVQDAHALVPDLELLGNPDLKRLKLPHLLRRMPEV